MSGILLDDKSRSILLKIDVMMGNLYVPIYNNELLCSICNHKFGWHHANMKLNGRKLVCYGISCECEGFVL